MVTGKCRTIYMLTETIAEEIKTGHLKINVSIGISETVVGFQATWYVHHHKYSNKQRYKQPTLIY